MSETARRTRVASDPRLKAYPDEFLNCRADRHELPGISTPDGVERWRFAVDLYVLVLRRVCRRCGTVEVRQIDEYDGTFYRPTKYVYPAGYKVQGQSSGDRVSAAASRLEVVKRYLKLNKIAVQRSQ